MEIDHITYYDLSILHQDPAFSVIQQLDFCKSHGGSMKLKYLLTHPHQDLAKIIGTQDTLKQIIGVLDKWPDNISNGTLLVLEKFYAYSFDAIPKKNHAITTLTYRIFSNPDFTLAKYSITHFCNFLSGMQKLCVLLRQNASPLIAPTIEIIETIIKKSIYQQIISSKGKKLKDSTMLQFAHFLYHQSKNDVLELIEAFYSLDAFYSMAAATQKKSLTFPEFTQENTPTIEVHQLYHVLLKKPIAYDVKMLSEGNFIFLTGANMAGKSTFIKSIGIAVYLAHVGMGVPAASMKLSLFNGLLSNIQIQDNLSKGESYFFNEVQRIKHTVLKITDGRKWLVLIDELFKGTNIQDAMQCSTAVIKGLLKIKSSAFILSTHLYEIASDLQQHANITFQYFESSTSNEDLHFSYQLREGISKDRIGYLILKKEKVIDLLNRIE
jgi:DNA mismatch repair ATPase MutS